MSDNKELSQEELEQVTGGGASIIGGDVELNQGISFTASNQDNLKKYSD